MALYHETAGILSEPSSHGGSLKTKVFGRKDLTSPPAQVYALALETCKWSPVLKEVIDNAQLLQAEKKLTPVLALLLVHDFLLAKKGIALPSSHGLRLSVERHKARITSEFTRSRLRRRCSALEALREQVELSNNPSPVHPRWVRVNALKSSLQEQLVTTFARFEKVAAIEDVLARAANRLYIDEHIPNLVAVSPGTDLSKSEAYKSGAIILQDKASCFPAYLLDPNPDDGDVIDSCAAPGNKTTHMAAIIYSRRADQAGRPTQQVIAFEKDQTRAKTLEKMVKLAGSRDFTDLNLGRDFLRTDPNSELYENVGALLLDPSCSGSGIVGRDDMPELHLPGKPEAAGKKAAPDSRKRKRKDPESEAKVLIDDDGNATIVGSEKDLQARLKALSSFQLTLLLHAFKFPSARRITYSTCSVHAEENENVVLQALQSDIAQERGWQILRREDQVEGMKSWPVRGLAENPAPGYDDAIADACIRAYKDDGRGVMGFFVAAFVRDGAAVQSPERRRSHMVADGAVNNSARYEHKADVSEEDAHDEWSGFDD